MAEIPRILRFSAVGGVNTLTDIGLFFVFYNLFHLVIRSNILFYGCGAILGFMLNRNWTFANAGHGRATGNLALRFAVVNLLALTLSTALVAALNLEFPLLLAKVISVGATAVFSYISMKLLVFSGSARNP